MASHNELTEPPEGIQILKTENGNQIFVINEVLSYYQRKCQLFTGDEALRLGHHKFDPRRMEDANKVLNSLWTWLKKTPSSSNNDHIINNLNSER